MYVCRLYGSIFVSTESSGDHGTLYQLRNLISRTNVGCRPEKNFNACDDFFTSIISAHILAALKELEYEDLDLSAIWIESKEERKAHVITVHCWQNSGQICRFFISSRSD